MGRLQRWLACAAGAIAIAGCTPGAPSAPSSNNQRAAGGSLVGVSILKYGQMSSSFGSVGGFNPAIIVLASGTTIQFHNEDSFNHTASSINATSFPGGNPIPSTALTQRGSDVSQPGWSSGALAGDAFSQTFGTSKTGTYLFGCFYHYPIMRGAIIVQ